MNEKPNLNEVDEPFKGLKTSAEQLAEQRAAAEKAADSGELALSALVKKATEELKKNTELEDLSEIHDKKIALGITPSPEEIAAKTLSNLNKSDEIAASANLQNQIDKAKAEDAEENKDSLSNLVNIYSKQQAEAANAVTEKQNAIQKAERKVITGEALSEKEKELLGEKLRNELIDDINKAA